MKRFTIGTPRTDGVFRPHGTFQPVYDAAHDAAGQWIPVRCRRMADALSLVQAARRAQGRCFHARREGLIVYVRLKTTRKPKRKEAHEPKHVEASA